MIQVLSLAAFLAIAPSESATPPPMPAVVTPTLPADRPRRNIRLAVAMGQGLVFPPICSRCDRFWGRGLAPAVEVGWTLRPDLVLSLEIQGTVIHFSDGTNGSVGATQLSALYFWRPRMFLRGAIGPGYVEVSGDDDVTSGPGLWQYTGPALTVGVGHDFHRAGALSVSVEARTTAVVTRNALAPALALLLGLSWN